MKFEVTVPVLAFALLPTLTPFGARAEAADRPLGLREAIALALEKNETIWIERKSLASAEAGVSGAKGAYDPVLEIAGGYRRATEPSNSTFSGAPEGELAPTVESGEANAAVRQHLPTGGDVTLRAGAARSTTDGTFEPLSPSYGTRLGVEVRQPLLRDRSVDAARLNVRVANAERNRSVASLRREIAETVAAVERAYWQLAAVLRAVEVGREAVRLAEEQLSLTQIRIDQGASPEDEAAQPRAELERRRGELLDAQEALARAENALKLLILGDSDAELWADRLTPTEEMPVEVTPVDIVAAMEHALASRPELEEVRAEIERRSAETAFAQSGVWPRLDAVAAYDRFGLSGEANPAAVPGDIDPASRGEWGRAWGMLGEGHYDDLRLGLEFSYPIRNRTARAARATARNAEEQANAELARARKAVRAEVLDAAAALETAGQRIEAARAGREAAEVQLTSEQERFAVGLSTNFLVLTRQNDLSQARLAEISAQTYYRTARTEMARVTGALLEERQIDVEATTP